MRKARTLRPAILIGAAGLAAMPAASQDEGGMRLYLDLSQGFEYGRNVGLEVPAEGSSSIATTRLTFGLISRTPLDTLEISAGTALVIENSPDTDGTEIDIGRPDLRFAYTREIPDAIFAVTANYRRDDVSVFLDDLDAADDTGTRTDTGATLRFETGRTGPLGFFTTAGFSRSDYQDVTDADLVDTETLSLGVGARLRFSEVVTGTGTLSFSRETDDDAAATETDRVTATFGVDYAVSERLDVTASVGVTEIETTEFGVTDRTTGPVANLGFAYAMPNGSLTGALTLSVDEDEGERVTLTFGRALDLPAGSLSGRIGVTAAEDGDAEIVGGLNWVQALPDGQFDVSLERSVSFDDDETEVVTSLEVGWDRRVNALSVIGLDFTYGLSDAPSERIEQATIGATYSYALTEDWSLDTGVRYRVRDDADGRAESPLVFLTVGRRFEFLR